MGGRGGKAQDQHKLIYVNITQNSTARKWQELLSRRCVIPGCYPPANVASLPHSPRCPPAMATDMLRISTRKTKFLIGVTKVSCQICSSDIIPGWDFQVGGIIILPIKNQWDNFAPRTKLILIKASNGEISKKDPGPSPGINITTHLLGFWKGEGEGSQD